MFAGRLCSKTPGLSHRRTHCHGCAIATVHPTGPIAVLTLQCPCSVCMAVPLFCLHGSALVLFAWQCPCSVLHGSALVLFAWQRPANPSVCHGRTPLPVGTASSRKPFDASWCVTVTCVYRGLRPCFEVKEEKQRAGGGGGGGPLLVGLRSGSVVMATVDDLKDGVYSASIACILSQTGNAVGEGLGKRVTCRLDRSSSRLASFESLLPMQCSDSVVVIRTLADIPRWSYYRSPPSQ